MMWQNEPHVTTFTVTHIRQCQILPNKSKERSRLIFCNQANCLTPEQWENVLLCTKTPLKCVCQA